MMNGGEMINQIDERYDDDTTKLHTSYDITYFRNPQDMEVL